MFNNTTTTRISTNGVLQAAADPATSWYYALLVAPSTQNTIDPTLAGWTYVGLGTNAAQAGRMASAFAAEAGGSPVSGTTGTSTADFAVVGWSGNLGSDFSAVFAGRPLVLGVNDFPGYALWWGSGGAAGGWYGISWVANDVPLAESGGPYNTIWGTSGLSRIQGMDLNLYYTPEPSALALAGLGAVALLISRSRKLLHRARRRRGVWRFSSGRVRWRWGASALGLWVLRKRLATRGGGVTYAARLVYLSTRIPTGPRCPGGASDRRPGRWRRGS
jgi:hypothetical protein